MSSAVILNGNPRPGSRTGSVAAELAGRLGLDDPVRLELSELVAVSFDAEAARPLAPRTDALDVITAADILIVATPSYKGTYTGLLKVFLDRLGPDALAGVRAIPLAVAGSPAHAAATGADLHRLLSALGATPLTAVTVLESELGDLDAALTPHVLRLRDELAATTAPSNS
jgi:FMN reductase